MNDFRTAAIALHELFTSYVEAGFTDDQALRLVIAHAVSASGGGGE